ncbi:hypothetical protein H9Q69_007210 [Fusarium xylarioides]|uniref:Uncharacterized protein n=1 Tax=Fusarium xylarioides TaxID=221167 RepID=A0A9P7HJZ4_9HYPO|nr:hypothetical protein H9Q72_010251 [Fusarium xylarioides]KAG5793746.1 hypothetical protein H9Q69_007210 [Fusarium xylarioides]
MAVNLLSCPDEVIDQIVKLLPNVKATRETCKRLNRIASPYLFPVLYISCHQLDLDVFRMVAKNPLLIGGVRELVIDDTTVPVSIPDWPTYQKVLSLPDLPENRRTFLELAASENWSDWPDCDEPKEHWELFDSILKGHHENRLARADYHALKQALPYMKRLRSLVLTNRTANDGIDDDFQEGAQSLESSSPTFKFWKRFESKRDYPPVSFAPRCDWLPTGQGLLNKTPIYGMDWLDDRLTDDITPCGVPNSLAGSPAFKELASKKFFEEEINGGRDLTDWDLFLYERAERLDRANIYKLFILAREARVLHLALLVLEDQTMQSQLTEFRVDASCDMPNADCSPGLAITVFDRQSPFPTRLAKGFGTTNITKFNLTLGAGLPLDVGVGDRLHTIFKSMPQLEELFFEPHDIHHFSAIPTEKTFPRLRKTTFNCGLMRLEQLFKFLRSHGATLKTLVVEHCKITLEPENEPQDMLPMLISELRSLYRGGALKLENGRISELFHGAVPQIYCGKLYRFSDEYNVTWDYKGNGVWEQREEVDSEDDLDI